MKLVHIYLAGTIQKNHETHERFTMWGHEEQKQLITALPEYQVCLLNPAFRTDNLSDQQSVFGRDMLQVFSSDVVFVDARDKRGLGVGAEMMWAKINSIPVISLAPKDSHYHRSATSILGVNVHEWVHPFIESLSDSIVETVEEGAAWIDAYMSNQKRSVKNESSIFEAMKYYKKSQLSKDSPMMELKKISDRLSLRFDAVER